jgi:hypothetical protein
MTRSEFDTWIDAHYTELRAVAFKKCGAQDAEDALHNAFSTLLDSQMLGVMPLSLAWPWTVSQIRSSRYNLNTSKKRRAAAHELISGDDPFAAAITDRGTRYHATPVKELNGAPLGAPWQRWVDLCPKCDGPASLEIVTDHEARVFSDGYTTTRQQAVFCINGHRADNKRGTRPQGGAR